MSYSCKCMGVNGNTLQLHIQLKKPYFFYYKSCENPYQYYMSRKNHQYYKSRALCLTCNEIKGLYDKIIMTIAPTYTGKKYHSFVAIGIVTRAAHL